MDEACSNFFFGCNLDFDIADSGFFKSFIKLLRPGYVPPKSEEISTTMLDTAFLKFEDRKKDFQNSPGILFVKVVDHQDKKSLISFISDLNGGIFFLKTFNISAEGHYDNNLNENVIAAMDLAASKYCVDIFAILSKDVLNSHMISNVWLLKCNKEIVNSVAETFSKKELFQNLCLILNDYKNNETLNDALKISFDDISQKNSISWMFEYNACSFFISNLHRLRQLLGEGKISFNQNITSLIFNDAFKFEVQDHFEDYEFLTRLIKKFEEDDFFIADAVQEWLKIYTNIKKINLPLTIEDHFSDVIHPVALAANSLHPHYQGRRLNSDLTKIVSNFLLENLDGKSLEQLVLYKAKKGIFSKLFEKNVVRPIAFWSLAEEENYELSIFAKKILQIPAFIIDIKCNFSKQQFLSKEIMEKRINLYYNLRISDTNK